MASPSFRPQQLVTRRHTLAREATVSGVGLFTATGATVRLRPAAAGAGIVFHRTDLPRDQAARPIPALASHVVPESRRTVLAADPDAVRAAVAAGGAAGAMAATLPTVQTVEHLLSALAGLGVSDVLIDVAGPELPIGDGSAGFWVEAVLAAGVVPADGAGRGAAAVVINEPIRVSDGGATVEALPLEAGDVPGVEFRYHLDYSDFPIAALAAIACKRVPAQEASIAWPLTPDDASRGAYGREVAPARTFCLAEEAQAMRAAGLFKHLTPREMLVIGDQGPIDNAWRFENPANEPARHKLLDLIGDLALCGRPIVGRIVATRSGHALNQELARQLMTL